MDGPTDYELKFVNIMISHRKWSKKKLNQSKNWDYEFHINSEEWYEITSGIQESYEEFDLMGSSKWRRIMVNMQRLHKSMNSHTESIQGNPRLIYYIIDKDELRDDLKELTDAFYVVICKFNSDIPIIYREGCLDMNEVKSIFDCALVKLSCLETNFIKYEEFLDAIDSQLMHSLKDNYCIFPANEQIKMQFFDFTQFLDVAEKLNQHDKFLNELVSSNEYVKSSNELNWRHESNVCSEGQMLTNNINLLQNTLLNLLRNLKQF